MSTQSSSVTKKLAETKHETQVSEAGMPVVMPDQDAALAAADEFIDFDARENAISTVRKDGGPAHRLTKKTRAKPSAEPETTY